MNERKFFTINENNAKIAHDMMSFSEYKEGKTTNEYKSIVNRAYDLADKISGEKPDEEERVYRLAERYSRKMAEYFNKESNIGIMCPSIMISGGSNFPVRKKEKQVAAFERNHQFYLDTQKILEKIENILYGKEIIKSSDEKAIEKLEDKLIDLKELQEQMKAANKAIRLKDIEKGNEKLSEMGYSDNDIEELRKPDFCGRIGYPDYKLANNNANIHRIEGRIKNLKAAKESGNVEREYKNFKIVKNTEIMRYQILFDGKPDVNIRNILKSNGFKWAPSQEAWQRQITNNGAYALKRVIKDLSSLEQ